MNDIRLMIVATQVYVTTDQITSASDCALRHLY